MISSFGGSKRCDTSEVFFRLWLGRITNRSARIRFRLCGETEDEEIRFKEITLKLHDVLEMKKLLLMEVILCK